MYRDVVSFPMNLCGRPTLPHDHQILMHRYPAGSSKINKQINFDNGAQSSNS
jgi:hypothetical protein